MPFELWLVEDNLDELRTAGMAIAEADFPINLRVAQDGETMALLRREGEFQDVPRPDLILLDLHLSAIDLLREIKENEDFKDIPIAVLGPCSEQAIDESFEHAADLYIAKPLDSQRLIMTVNWAQGL
ncbi:MAG TPA: response regulator [Nitrospirales bacterium]|jgi:two-component system response regulator